MALRACGVLVCRREPELSFLLMRHVDRWDLPKGHVDHGESDLECALRELREETGITPDDIELDQCFRFETEYEVPDRKDKDRRHKKSLRIYLAWLNHDVPIAVTEHLGYQWFRWQPPHRIQSWTIDPLLDAVARHLDNHQPTRC